MTGMWCDEKQGKNSKKGLKSWVMKSDKPLNGKEVIDSLFINNNV